MIEPINDRYGAIRAPIDRFLHALLVMYRRSERLGALSFLMVVSVACAVPPSHGDSGIVDSVYWSDADSGRIDGKPFRLANVDAPETGGVGARGGAQCESERALGYVAKAFMIGLTRQGELRVTAVHGIDRHERQVVDLAIDGNDVASAGLAAGHLAPWPHRGQRALAPKPRWCSRR